MPFGANVGRRLDGRAHFADAIDDVRVRNRASGDEEPATGRPASATAGAVVWLPVDRVRR
ncbi:hypothetical protein GCM10027072_02040 [Streptomyces bullii]